MEVFLKLDLQLDAIDNAAEQSKCTKKFEAATSSDKIFLADVRDAIKNGARKTQHVTKQLIACL